MVSGQERDRAVAEMSAAVAVVSAAQEVRAGRMSAEEFGQVLAPVLVESFEQPLEIVQPLAFMVLSALDALAAATGGTVADLLARFGADVAGPPPDVNRLG